jgi:uncharacterized protein
MLEAIQTFWTGCMSALQSVDWACIGVWSLTLSLLVVGLLGAVLPFVPGPLLIFIAGIVHTWLRPESGMSWQGIVLLALLLVIAYFLDIASGAMGARWFGASKWGILGVFVGGVVGLFFALPGLILGPIVGGLSFELLFAKKEMRPAMKSTWGTLVGTGAGLVLRLAVSIAMLATFFVDALWW